MKRSSAPSRRHFNPPLSKVSKVSSNPSSLNQENQPIEKNESEKPSNNSTEEPKKEFDKNSKYFNVVWCKFSKKKHKQWEGDAVLIIEGRSVNLLDMDGKSIGKSSGYKASDLNSLKEGETLGVGGKQIEVMGTIKAEDFESGKCFGSAPQTVLAVSKTSTSSRKPFVNPLKNSQAHSPIKKVLKEPRFDPTTPDALVMPEHPNKACIDLDTVSVVVDPHLSRHLRPHQREGVSFIYKCIMGYQELSGGSGVILATLLKQGPFGKPILKKILIVTPSSLIKNWEKEFRKWLGTERLRVFAAGIDSKPDEFKKNLLLPVLIISYESLVRYIDNVKEVNFDLIVCDEGHRIPCTRRIVLSGTPVQNDLQELFSIADFCNPGLLGNSASFRRLYEEPIVKSRMPSADKEQRALGEKRAIELGRITSLFLLRRTSEVNRQYLPPKVEIVIFCRPVELQMKLYEKLLSSGVVNECIHTSDSAQHLMLISALKKLCNHPSLLYRDDIIDDENELEEGDKSLIVNAQKVLQSAFPKDIDLSKSNPEYSGKLKVLSQLLANVYEESKGKEKIVLVSNYTQNSYS
ncbi:DgyrCDS6671 [Dimorphilus gyrociliatus]|uniref:DgyrCDS6671 n=1 Tax=Dimorphilus gyrociliatus TaxID=2664684 RepID=A0A7I8VR02_9ANNE|nr:DgyrCDS6671 [Dimorphilus gyrociliatus]